tara:strand:- start:215 stop:604 length:390 start_codon:yes stop_codon:yes gene_type:complete
MSEKFKVEVITPDQTILQSDAIEVTIPSFEGQMGILKNHIPLITFLRPGIILIKNNEVTRYYVEEGIVEFSNDNLLILTSTARDLKNFDRKLVDNLLAKAQNDLSNADKTDKEKYIESYKIDTLKELNQ